MERGYVASAIAIGCLTLAGVVTVFVGNLVVGFLIVGGSVASAIALSQKRGG